MCLLFQHCRVDLRLQVEWGLNALMDLFSTETSRMSHEKKEAVLETIVQVHIANVHVHLFKWSSNSGLVNDMYVFLSGLVQQPPYSPF